MTLSADGRADCVCDADDEGAALFAVPVGCRGGRVRDGVVGDGVWMVCGDEGGSEEERKEDKQRNI